MQKFLHNLYITTITTTTTTNTMSNTFNIDEIYHSNADFYKVIRRTRCFIYLQQVNDEFETNGKMRRNWIHKTIKRKVKKCGDVKVSISQLEYEGEFITLGFNSKHDNLFSSNAFWKIELSWESTLRALRSRSYQQTGLC